MLLGAVILALVTTAPPDSVQVVQRLRSITALAAQEYAIGVVNGKVVAEAEVEEAKLFFEEARRTAENLPTTESKRMATGIDSLLQMIARTAPADSVSLRSHDLLQQLAARFGVPLDEIPPQNPSLVIGAGIYLSRCAACHGETGKGDGAAGRGLTPPPANLTDARLLADATLLDFYRRVTIGVAGTAMPAFENQLTQEERWAVAAYAGTFRTGGAAPKRDFGLVFATVRRQLDSGVTIAGAGQGAAGGTSIFDAYMTFEQAEREVRARNAALATKLETGFADLRTRASTGATAAELTLLHRALLADLENAERTVSDRLSPLNLFTQSVILLVREGLEAILVVGAILAFLVKTGSGHRRREIHAGVIVALGASLITAYVLESVLRASRVSQESLEGGIMLLAAAMLFYVSYWLLSKLEVAKWNRFVRTQVQGAVGSGSTFALASVAFLAVYREGFETVLFYKALFLSGPGSLAPVVAGMVVGSILLTIAYYAINRFGVRLPLKPFFGFTSAFLYYMAFVFAGKGIAELQEGGVVGTRIVGWAPRVPAMGIYPTVESLTAQGVLLLVLIAGLVWTFVIEPRRREPPVEPALVRESSPR